MTGNHNTSLLPLIGGAVIAMGLGIGFWTPFITMRADAQEVNAPGSAQPGQSSPAVTPEAEQRLTVYAKYLVALLHAERDRLAAWEQRLVATKAALEDADGSQGDTKGRGTSTTGRQSALEHALSQLQKRHDRLANKVAILETFVSTYVTQQPVSVQPEVLEFDVSVRPVWTHTALHVAPSRDSAVMTTIPQGQPVIVLASVSGTGWRLVSARNAYGFLWGQLLAASEPEPQAEPQISSPTGSQRVAPAALPKLPPPALATIAPAAAARARTLVAFARRSQALLQNISDRLRRWEAQLAQQQPHAADPGIEIITELTARHARLQADIAQLEQQRNQLLERTQTLVAKAVHSWQNTPPWPSSSSDPSHTPATGSVSKARQAPEQHTYRFVEAFDTEYYRYFTEVKRKMEQTFAPTSHRLWLVLSQEQESAAAEAPVAGVAIRRSGALAETVLLRSSGKPALDQALLDAIQAAAPFAPLPAAFPDEEIGLRVYATSSRQ